MRIGQRVVELLQKRTGDGYVARVDLRLRPSPEVTPIALPVDAAISYYESQRLAVGAGGLHPRPRRRRRPARSGSISSTRSIRSSGGARSISARSARSAQIRRASATIMRKAQAFGPGYDLKRGRGGIREVEFFAQIHQLIHGGREPALRAPATLDALAALGRRAGSTRQPRRARRRLSPAAHDRAPPADGRRRQTQPAAPTRRRSTMSRGSTASPTATRCSTCCGRMSSASGRSTTASRGDERGGLSNDPDMLRGELAHARLRRSRRGRAAHRAAGARARRARCARRPRRGVRGDAAGADRGARRRRPIRCARSTASSDIVERLPSGVNFFRLLEARPALASCWRTILSHAPALAEQLARRPELLDGLIDAASFAPPPAGRRLRRALRRGDARRGLSSRARPGAAAGQRAPLRARACS